MSADGAPSSLPNVPWSRVAFAYALGLSLVELVAILLEPALFRAVVVADASIGWVVVIASVQGLRAVPYPPPIRAMLVTSFAASHWVAALLGAAGAIGAIAG